MISSSTVYDTVNARRLALFDLNLSTFCKTLKTARAVHAESKEFLRALADGDLQAVRIYITNHAKTF